MSNPSQHLIEQAAHTAAAKLLTHRFTRVVGCGDEADALAIVDDLKALAAIFDPVILAVGELINESFSEHLDIGNFRNVVLRALESEAIPETEYLADKVAWDDREMRADARGWNAAAHAGVD